MAGSFGSWLSGPPPVEPGAADQRPNDYPGQRLGLPPSGPQSLARMGRRIGALSIDWLIGYGLAALAMTFGWFGVQALSTAVLVVWFVLGAVSVRLFGFTPGAKTRLSTRATSISTTPAGAYRLRAGGVFVACRTFGWGSCTPTLA